MRALILVSIFRLSISSRVPHPSSALQPRAAVVSRRQVAQRFMAGVLAGSPAAAHASRPRRRFLPSTRSTTNKPRTLYPTEASALKAGGYYCPTERSLCLFGGQVCTDRFTKLPVPGETVYVTTSDWGFSLLREGSRYARVVESKAESDGIVLPPQWSPSMADCLVTVRFNDGTLDTVSGALKARNKPMEFAINAGISVFLLGGFLALSYKNYVDLQVDTNSTQP